MYPVLLTLSMPNLRRHLSSFYVFVFFFFLLLFFFSFFLTNYCLERSLYVKLKDLTSNSIDPNETAHYEPSHLDLCCLQKLNLIAYGSERVK